MLSAPKSCCSRSTGTSLFLRLLGTGRRDDLDDTIAYLFALLYVWHDRQACGQEMFRWAADPLVHEEQIRSGLWIVREAASAGYDADSRKAREPRERFQGVIKAVVDHLSGA